MIPLIDLTSLPATDGELLRSVPRALATYYAALPLAREDGRVTVVTAHPDNHAAFQLLERLLGGDVVPVSNSESAVFLAIEQAYAEPLRDRCLLAWTTDPVWRDHVRAMATLYGDLLSLPVESFPHDAAAPDFSTLGRYSADSFLVAHFKDLAQVSDVMGMIPVSLLLTGHGTDDPRDRPRSPQRILLALRGYGSDRAMIDQMRHCAERASVAMTILPLESPHARHPSQLVAAVAAGREHLDLCLNNLGETSATVRLRAGTPSERLSAELAGDDYDLLVMASEAWGEFVVQTLSQLDDNGALPDCPIMILRPPVCWDAVDALPAETPAKE